jgi:hypothetical protein
MCAPEGFDEEIKRTSCLVSPQKVRISRSLLSWTEVFKRILEVFKHARLKRRERSVNGEDFQESKNFARKVSSAPLEGSPANLEKMFRAKVRSSRRSISHTFEEVFQVFCTIRASIGTRRASHHFCPSTEFLENPYAYESG